MSETNSTHTSDQSTYLLNRDLNYTAIASLLDRDEQFDKFKSIIASTNLETIAVAIAQALEGVLTFKPLIETMKTPSGRVVFREDRKYFSLTDGGFQEFNPFVADGPADGDVYCDKMVEIIIAKKNLQRVWCALEFDYIGNPLLQQVAADLLTITLNEGQEWTKLYHRPSRDFLQEYISLEKLVENKQPALAAEYRLLLQDIYTAGNHRRTEILINEFWSRREVVEISNELTNALGKIILNLFPAMRIATERSIHPAYGYDVYFAVVDKANQMIVRRLGDYRIFQWETQQ
jgi:hypothetical protein